jgi:hypothetical protein
MGINTLQRATAQVRAEWPDRSRSPLASASLSRFGIVPSPPPLDTSLAVLRKCRLMAANAFAIEGFPKEVRRCPLRVDNMVAPGGAPVPECEHSAMKV